VNISIHKCDEFDSELYQYITKAFIIKLTKMINKKDYFNCTEITYCVKLSDATYHYENLSEFDDNTSPNDVFDNISIHLNPQLYAKEIIMDSFSIHFSPNRVSFFIDSDTLTNAQANSIIADIREDIKYLLECAISGEERQQTKQYRYSISDKSYHDGKTEPFVWYRSALFWTIAGVAVAILIGAATIILQIIK